MLELVSEIADTNDLCKKLLNIEDFSAPSSIFLLDYILCMDENDNI